MLINIYKNDTDKNIKDKIIRECDDIDYNKNITMFNGTVIRLEINNRILELDIDENGAIELLKDNSDAIIIDRN